MLRLPVSRWAVWQLPTRVGVVLLVVEAAALALILWDAVAPVRGYPPTAADWRLVALFAAALGLHVELSVQAQRRRRRVADTRYCDLSSIWTFSAALTLPPFLASVLVVGGLLFIYFRVARPAGTPPHRHAFSVATMILAVFATHGVHSTFTDTGSFRGAQGAAVLAFCILGYALTNMMLVAGVVRISRPQVRFREIFRGGDIPLELTGLCIGGLVAVVIGPTAWPFLLILLPLLIMLERTMLVAPLREGATLDSKTGLLNSESWRSQTQRVLNGLDRSSGAMAVLILDLDFFKQVNDRYGHLAGDRVLRAISDVIVSEIRDRDLAGRFGGEEFVVSLTGLSRADGAVVAREVSERIRQRVESLSVTVPTAGGESTVAELSISVGAAIYPDSGDDLTLLLSGADKALYAAKQAGRNQVALA